MVLREECKKLTASGIVLLILGILITVILLPNATPIEILLFHHWTCDECRLNSFDIHKCRHNIAERL